MAGVKALRKIQLGRETTAGTAVAATTIWRGMGTIEDQREVVFVEEDIGYLSGVDRSYIPKLGAQIEMEEVEATFEQLPHIFEAGIGTVTPATDGSGSDYVYSYVMATTAQPTIKTYTIEGGDNQEVEEMEYGFVSEFGLNGVAGEALKVSATWVGRQATVSSFTGGATLPTVEEILFSKGLLYIDAAGGTIGSTLISNSLLGVEFKASTGMVPVYTADGQLYFSFTKMIAPEVTVEVTFEHDSNAAAQKVLWRAGTARLLRLSVSGSALTTAGSTYSNKTLIVDLAGKWEKFDKIDEQDGNDILKGTFRARYNSTAALFAEIVVVNELSSLP